MPNAVHFKLAAIGAREAISALMTSAPWYARPQLEALLNCERGVEFRVEPIKRKRTTEQAGYYWLCLKMFAKHYGCGPDELHNVILMEAFGRTEIETANRVYDMPLTRSSKLTVEDYSTLIDTLHRVAAFSGYALPDPETVA